MTNKTGKNVTIGLQKYSVSKQQRRSWEQLKDAVERGYELRASGEVPALGPDDLGDAFTARMQALIDERSANSPNVATPSTPESPLVESSTGKVVRWVANFLSTTSSSLTDELPVNTALADSTGTDETSSDWKKHFELATDAWVMEAWACEDGQEVRLIPGPKVNAELLCGVELIGITTNKIVEFTLVSRETDDQASERIVIEELTLERLYVTCNALLKADEARRTELIPRLLLEQPI